ncbi:MAG: seg [Candidatus Kaiserbacteria bacterium]|nr:seg [Candidatus Kaiserbacteria bacterium]
MSTILFQIKYQFVFLALVVIFSLFSPFTLHALNVSDSCEAGTVIARGSAGSTAFFAQAPQNAQFGCGTTNASVLWFDQSQNLLSEDNSLTKTRTDTAGNTTKTPASPSTCSVGVTGVDFDFNECVLSPTITFISSLFIMLGALCLRLAGTFFDALLSLAVTDFGKGMDLFGLKGLIPTIWTVFRDLSNIVIIGLFAFIAISIILGLKEFGDKKMIARVIVIAVLINFSLLFAKLIIDASNLTAVKFYDAGVSSDQKDIAASFLKPLGITSIWTDSAGVINKAASSTSNPGGAADLGFRFIYGLFAGILLFGIAVVLFYGCYLLFLRFLMLILVMLTSAIAFATYLHPALSNSHFGWDMWWKTLINNAIFGPILMLMLAISLKLLSGVSQNTLSLGNLINPAAAPPDAAAGVQPWTVLFTYLLVTGLLLVSFKMSRILATNGGGAMSGIGDFAGKALGVAGAFGLAGGSGLAARGLQNYAGRNALKEKVAHENEQKSLRFQMANLDQNSAAFKQKNERLAELEKLKAAADTKSKRSYNFMDTKLGQSGAKLLGREGAGQTSKDKKDGFYGKVQRTGKDIDERSKVAKMSNDEKKEYADTKAADHDRERDAIAAERTRASQDIENMRKAAADSTGEGAQFDNLKNAVVIATNEKATALNAIDTERKSAEQDYNLAQANKDEAAASIASMRMEAAKATRQQQIKQQDAKIESATKSLISFHQKLDTTIGAPMDSLKARYNDSGKKLAEHDKKGETVRTDAIKEAESLQSRVSDHLINEEVDKISNNPDDPGLATGSITERMRERMRTHHTETKDMIKSATRKFSKQRTDEEKLKERAQASGRRYTPPKEDGT